MSDVLESLNEWFLERPKWLQDAANRLRKQPELSDEDIRELVALCKKEAEGKLPATTSSFVTTTFSRGVASPLRLCSISEVEGVNALAPKKPLEFDKSNITIVYGNNGSGKSGYVRLLKHICGARELGTLHNNVYKPGTAVQKACISFAQGDESKTFTWAGQGICDDLGSVDIFDTSFGKVFVSRESEVSYEPPLLFYFSSLILACEKVASALEVEINSKQSKKPNIPTDKKVTPEGRWYEAISAKTTTEDIDKYCSFNGDDEAEIQRLHQRLSEQKPAEKAKQLRKQKQHVESLIKDARKHLEQLSDENFRKIIAAKKEAILRKAAAESAAKEAFCDSELEGIGSDVWKELWEAARKYSVSIAYEETEYPNVSDGSRCVLCHQLLTAEAKRRLMSFESFVKEEMQKAAADAFKAYEAANQSIEELPTMEMLKARIDATGISQDEFGKQVMDFFDQLQGRKDLLSGIESEEDIPDTPLVPKWIEEAEKQCKTLSELATEYDKDTSSDSDEGIKKALSSLQTRKWLSEHRAAIDEEVSRLKLLNQIEKAKKLTSTRALSQKKGELADVLITDAFVKRFNSELKTLGASQLKVELGKTCVSKGRVLHKIWLQGASQYGLADVLSEGENRIVSIAAFLADVTGNSSKSPFIFDDPISSLDQEYEEAVVRRLIQLSQDRQIIVFTHRLSLLGTFSHFAKKKGLTLDLKSIRSADWGTGEPAPIPLSRSDIGKALNRLLNERFAEAKKASEKGDFDLEETLIKSICSDFRVLLERSIENDLLWGVIQRFQRPVETLKIRYLANLREEDISLLDSLMTKYSGFEHSQPLESPVQLPKLDDLLGDMTALKTWREEYIKRV